MSPKVRLALQFVRVACTVTLLLFVGLPGAMVAEGGGNCPEWCPEVGHHSCATPGWCQEREGQSCNSPTIPEGCGSCKYVYECHSDWICTGQAQGQEVYRCVLGNTMN